MMTSVNFFMNGNSNLLSLGSPDDLTCGKTEVGIRSRGQPASRANDLRHLELVVELYLAAGE